MRLSWFCPRVVIWVGVAVSIGGALLEIFVPQAVSNLYFGEVDASSQDALVTVEVVLRTAAGVFPPLGIGLISAGIVMAYINLKLTADVTAINPDTQKVLPEEERS